jgi:hypothetical protein
MRDWIRFFFAKMKEKYGGGGAGSKTLEWRLADEWLEKRHFLF